MSTEQPEALLYGLIRLTGENAEDMVDMLAQCQATGLGIIYCPEHEVGVLIFHKDTHERPHTRIEQQAELQCLAKSFRTLTGDFPVDAEFDIVPSGLMAFMKDLQEAMELRPQPGTEPNPN